MRQNLCVCDICKKDIPSTEERHEVTDVLRSEKTDVAIINNPSTINQKVKHYDICNECFAKIFPAQES